MQHLSDFIFNLYELFPAFICANNIASLVNISVRVNIFDHFPSLFLHHLLVVACQINLYHLFFVFLILYF